MYEPPSSGDPDPQHGTDAPPTLPAEHRLPLHPQIGRAPKALRFRLLAVPARLVRHARKRILKLPDDWAWTEDLITAWTRLHALHPH